GSARAAQDRGPRRNARQVLDPRPGDLDPIAVLPDPPMREPPGEAEDVDAIGLDPGEQGRLLDREELLAVRQAVGPATAIRRRPRLRPSGHEGDQPGARPEPLAM